MKKFAFLKIFELKDEKEIAICDSQKYKQLYKIINNIENIIANNKGNKL